jgi:hypothetical protein
VDTFSACVALGPLGIYLLLLGSINFSRRPLIINGTRETLSLGLALMGLIVVGPMQLFMPQEAAAHFGGFVWLFLMAFYLLCLTLVVMLSRPRLIVYNISLELLHGVLEETARRLDPDATWAGQALNMPLSRVRLQLECFPPLCNVALLATGDDQSLGGWRRLETALRVKLRDTPVAVGPHGFWLALFGLAILAALAFWVAGNPQAIAHGFQRLLHP